MERLAIIVLLFIVNSYSPSAMGTSCDWGKPFIGTVTSVKSDGFYSLVALKNTYNFDLENLPQPYVGGRQTILEILTQYNKSQLPAKNRFGSTEVKIHRRALAQINMVAGDLLMVTVPYNSCALDGRVILRSDGRIKGLIGSNSGLLRIDNDILNIHHPRDKNCGKCETLQSRAKFCSDCEISLDLNSQSYRINPESSMALNGNYIKRITLFESHFTNQSYLSNSIYFLLTFK